MKYALFEFLEKEENEDGNGLAVGESNWIVDMVDDLCNNENFDFDCEVEVRWPASGKKSGTGRETEYWPAKVHRFSGT